MTNKIAILGSTGSIGRQALDVARNLGIHVLGLSANTNIDLLEKQALEFRPEVISVGSEDFAQNLRNRLNGLDIQVFSGVEGMKKIVSIEEVDTILTSVVGIAGLVPTIEAIRNGKNIALANKETLVTAGKIVMDEALKHNVKILPVDSEHSAIFQCLMGNDSKDVAKIILTASGGPFRNKKYTELENVTVKDALNHPNWSMGRKITIDSATLMNKGLEVIEAKWLFGLSTEQIEVLIHPQSVIHSMVEYRDNSVIAQLGSPDMRIPIQFALTYPQRAENKFSRLNLLEIGKLTFAEPDLLSFPCLDFAFKALAKGGTTPAVLNAANEVAVDMFLNEKIKFLDIPFIIDKVMQSHSMNINPSLEDIIEVDKWARTRAIEVQNLM